MCARAVDTAGLLLLDGGGRAASVVSGTARGGTGWVACSALLAIDRRTRPAARDGLAAWVGAQLAAAGLKRVIDRRRPRLRSSGLATHSSSMPSAHTASGVAYAVAAGAAVPAVGVPLGALALAVGWSRLATRRHFPSDVAAAVVLGAAVGVGVHQASDRMAPG